MTAINDFPQVTFRIGTGETKSDREWLKKKKEHFEQEWGRNGLRILRKIEESCGNAFTETSRQEGITILLHKKTPKDQIDGRLNADNPLEVSLYLTKNDTTGTLKELLVRMLVYSFIQQQYEFCFRMREQTLFEDILADELVAARISFVVMGKKLGRANCAKALGQAIEQTVYRLSQKGARERLVDFTYGFFQECSAGGKKQKVDVLASREELISKLLELLPKATNPDV